jgi:hypothetical protein
MSFPSTPDLAEVFRLTLKKIEETSYPTQDPSSIEEVKAHIRSRIAELEAGDGDPSLVD